MTIESTTDYRLILRNNQGQITNIVPPNAFIQLHPRETGTICISMTPTNQDERECIPIQATQVSQINGVNFTGSRDALMDQMALIYGYTPPRDGDPS